MKFGEETLTSAVIGPERLRIGAWVAWIIAITMAFVQPLIALLRHAFQSDFNSYIPLVPFVAAYLLYLKLVEGPPKGAARPRAVDSSIAGAALLGAIGLAAVATALTLQATISANDRLTLMTLGYVSFVAAGGFLFLGWRWMAAAAFPMAFLIFMVPLPDAAVNRLETLSVLASAEVSALFFNLTGTPILREGTQFALPGIVIVVAQECSGIRSSWILLITSLLASHLFLTSPWRRAALVTFVIPLAIVRNAFRILVISLLCVHIGPHMIDSPIHHRGGPLFFALSLVPLLMWLAWLRRRERA